MQNFGRIFHYMAFFSKYDGLVLGLFYACSALYKRLANSIFEMEWKSPLFGLVFLGNRHAKRSKEFKREDPSFHSG